MEIATPIAHQALAYVDAVSRNGAVLTVRQFEAYMQSPTPIMKVTGDMTAAMNTLLERMIPFMGQRTEEPTLKWLTRVEWLEEKDGRILVTRLGKAVLGALEEGSEQKELPAELILDRDDTLAYARLLGTFAQAGEAALVDRYLSLEGFWEVAHQTGVTRFLVRPDAELAASLGAAMRAPTLSKSLELRTSDEIHDRFLVPKHGRVRTMGTSLNGVGRRLAVSMVLGEAMSEAVRVRFEQAWERATPVVLPERIEGDGVETTSATSTDPR